MEAVEFNSENFNDFDDESDEGISSEEDITNENVKRVKKEKNKQKAKKIKNELYKPPTNEELNRLRETENLFNSNLFRLQIEELLKEANIKDKRITEFNSWFKNFESFIDGLKEYEDIKISRLAQNKGKSKKQKFIDLLNEKSYNYLNADQDLTLNFKKPKNFFSFGSFKTQLSLEKFMDFNINVTIPKCCFQEKDYLNNRYFVKRYYYLLYFGVQLEKSGLCSSIFNNFFEGNVFTPILCIVPSSSKKITIRIFFTPSNESFKLSRFDLDKNNIKANLFEEKVVDVEEFKTTTTVFYNSSFLHDLVLNVNNESVERNIGALKNVQDGIKLIVIWLTQRNLNNGLGSFSNKLATIIVLYLVLKHKINKFMSSYQVIRIFWNFLNTTDWSVEPISLCDNVKPVDLINFKNHFDVTVVDVTGHLNVAAFLDLNVYFKVKSEANFALHCMDENKFNSFEALFTTQLPFSTQYDAVLIVRNKNNFEEIVNIAKQEEIFKYLGCRNRMIIKKIADVFKEALNKRIKHFVPYFEDESAWLFGKERKPCANNLMFGITLNPEYAFNSIEMGPAQYDPKAGPFREFWGDLSELRRFKDGTICEAVYFESNTLQEKRQIFKRIIDFVSKEKLKVNYRLVSDDFEKILKQTHVIPPFKTGTNEEATLQIKTSFVELSKKLREIKLPLSISSVQGISEIFCYTEVFPPLPTNYRCGHKITTEFESNIVFKNDKQIGVVPKYVQAIECVLELALNSKWPNDLKALRCMLTEFYFEMSKLLKEDYKIVSTVKIDHIDVLYKGFVFRCRLFQPKEVSLLKKYIDEEGVVAYKDTPESLELEKKLDVVPKIVGALNGIQQQYSSFGPSTTIIKRWLRSQLIDDYYLSDIAVALLNASLFLQSSPFCRANLPQIAFLRFLKYISEADFNLQPVIVNFNDEISQDQLTELESDFQQNRNKYPELFIATPYDDVKSVFTNSNPTKTILRRICVLAGETFKFIQNSIDNSVLINAKDLMLPNFEGYNVLIHLKPLLIARKDEYIGNENPSTVQILQYKEEEDEKLPIVNFDPVQEYLRELRDNYGELALFFHDTYGGPTIGVLWKTDASQNQKTTQLNNSSKLTSNKNQLNLEAVVEDFYILGNGLIKTIEQT